MGVRTGVERRPVAGRTAAAGGWVSTERERARGARGKEEEKERERIWAGAAPHPVQ